MVSLNQSKTVMYTIIDKNIMDMANTAAAMLDGDALGSLTEADVDGPVFRDILQRLTVFQDNTDILYIYTVRALDDGRFVFLVDPDPVDPGLFGEEITVTEAVISASKGVPMVDNEVTTDRWGTYYSAYSPVYDSKGQMAGIVGIDFDTKWYDARMEEHAVTAVIITCLSALLGGVIVALIARGVYSRIRGLNTGLSNLSASVNQLTAEIGSIPGIDDTARREDTQTPGDELEALSLKIDVMQGDLRRYLNFLEEKTYIDALTHARSSTAYHELIQSLETEIREKTARFSVAVFDLNSLKEINDHFGHEYGDTIIIGAAATLAGAFGDKQVYRIGGDEFAAVLQGDQTADMERCMTEMKTAIAKFNDQRSRDGVRLSLAMGSSTFRPERDHSYRDVFSRADKRMYEDKREYYRQRNERPRDQETGNDSDPA